MTTTSTTAHEDLLARRADYPVLERKTYLASHTLGAMHRRTPEKLAEFTGLWAEQGVVSWETWAPEVERVADLVGSLIGAPPGTTVMRQNVADLLGDLVSCFDWHGRRNRVVTSALEWPGSLHTWSQIGRLGGQLVVVPGDEDGIHFDVSRMVEAIDESTLLVECSHVLFRTSTVVDLAPIVEKAHRRRALVVVDGYQAAGTCPVDVVALGADVYLGGSVKYLSGGPATAGCTSTRRGGPAGAGQHRLVRPGRRPSRSTPRTPTARASALRRRYARVPAAYAAEPAYAALAEIGMSRVRERSVSMTQAAAGGRARARLHRPVAARPGRAGRPRDHRPGRQRPGARRADRPRHRRGPPARGRASGCRRTSTTPSTRRSACWTR
jgi:kynureninase